MSQGRVTEVLNKRLNNQQGSRCQEHLKMLGNPLQYHWHNTVGWDLPENVKKDLGDDASNEELRCLNNMAEGTSKTSALYCRDI
jgi:hypothetical protein